MNYVIARTNSKGQLVIPVAMRKYWDITEDTPLEVINIPDSGIFIKKSTNKPKLTNAEYLAILDETKGAWADDDWPKTEKKQRQLAIKEARDQRANSW